MTKIVNKIKALRPKRYLHTPDKQFLLLCPLCNAAFALPEKTSKRDQQHRIIETTCGSCNASLTARIPPAGQRLGRVYQCPPRKCRDGGAGAVVLPPIHLYRDPARMGKPGSKANKPLLRSGLLCQPHNYPPLKTLTSFPVRPVIEQAAFAVRHGLPIDVAVLSTLALEHQYIFSIPPRTMVLEMLIAGMVSAMLPVTYRPLPPGWAFTHDYARQYGQVSFPTMRQWYGWGRSRPLITPAPPALLHRLRSFATALAPLRRYVLANVRRITADQYCFPGHVMPTVRCASLGLYAWETCCPGVRLDYSEQYELCRDLSAVLVLM